MILMIDDNDNVELSGLYWEHNDADNWYIVDDNDNIEISGLYWENQDWW